MTTILKKLVVLMMLVMFIVSVAQIALAENDTEVDVESDEKVAAEAKVSTKGKDLVKEEKKQAIKELKAEKKEVMKESKDKIKMIKEESKEKLQDLREKVKKEREAYKEVKEKHKDLREGYHKENDDLKKLKGEASKCVDADTSCKSKKDEVKKGVQMHLIKTVDLIESSLARLKARVEASATLSAEEKTQALADIDALQTKLTAQKDAVVALGAKEGVTNEELKAAVKDLKKMWEEVRKVQKRIIAGMMNAENDNAVEKHKEYGTSMQKKIDNLKAKGADVAGLVALQTEFVAAQAKLEADRTAALTAWKAAENKADAQNAWKEAQAVVKEDLQKSKEILRKFSALHKELAKKAGVKEEAEESTTVPVVESTAATTTVPSTEASATTDATTEATASS